MPELEDAIIDAGLAHTISWAQAERMIHTLTANPWDLSGWITVDELLEGIGGGKVRTRGKQGLDDTSRDAGSIPARSTTSRRAAEAPF